MVQVIPCAFYRTIPLPEGVVSERRSENITGDRPARALSS
jgi:hypothetical protein